MTLGKQWTVDDLLMLESGSVDDMLMLKHLSKVLGTKGFRITMIASMIVFASYCIVWHRWLHRINDCVVTHRWLHPHPVDDWMIALMIVLKYFVWSRLLLYGIDDCIVSMIASYCIDKCIASRWLHSIADDCVVSHRWLDDRIDDCIVSMNISYRVGHCIAWLQPIASMIASHRINDYMKLLAWNIVPEVVCMNWNCLHEVSCMKLLACSILYEHELKLLAWNTLHEVLLLLAWSTLCGISWWSVCIWLAWSFLHELN
jgi:hypothetical protein